MGRFSAFAAATHNCNSRASKAASPVRGASRAFGQQGHGSVGDMKRLYLEILACSEAAHDPSRPRRLPGLPSSSSPPILTLQWFPDQRKAIKALQALFAILPALHPALPHRAIILHNGFPSRRHSYRVACSMIGIAVTQHSHDDGRPRRLFFPIAPLRARLSMEGMSKLTASSFLVLNSMPSRRLSGEGATALASK
jgi:hypothetical protein